IIISFLNNNNNSHFDDGVLYISGHFEGPLFERLLAQKKPIISDLIIQSCIEEKTPLPLPRFPLFNYQMKNFVICFSTTDKRQTKMINRYLNLIRFMAGQSRRDMKSGKSFDRTHLIETSTESDNYKLAVIYGIPILGKEWIDHVWDNRRRKPFTRLKIALYNYPEEEEVLLNREIKENGGEVITPAEAMLLGGCSHMVVKIGEQESVEQLQAEVGRLLEAAAYLPRFVLTDKWLIQCLETLNREDEEVCRLKVPQLLMAQDGSFSSRIVINSSSSGGSSNCCTPTKISSDDSMAQHTLSSLLLSPIYDKSFEEVNLIVDKADLKKQAITQELYQTEVNYVTILKDILKIFHEPLKNHQTPGELPNEIELKTMFGGLPPIVEVHERILRELEPVVTNWRAENEVGEIFQKHSKAFLTVYPQYINFFEQTKEMIDLCNQKYPRFSKFIRASQLHAECKKQTFQELLINPIQRLPRIEMYLRALLSKTDSLHPDYRLLNEALSTIVSVNSEINQEKKKTEGQMEMFEILNDIEEAPADILSANRHFLAKVDARLLVQSDGGGAGGMKTMHKLETYIFSLFSLLIRLCGTIRRANSLRENKNSHSVMKKARKSYKYIETIDFSMLREIYTEFDENEQVPEAENTFVLVCHPMGVSSHFSAYPFVVTAESELSKQAFVSALLKAYQALKREGDYELTATKGCISLLDFKNTRSIARNLNGSTKFFLMQARERLNRTFSVRRSTAAHLASSVSLENLNASFSRWPFSGSPSTGATLFELILTFFS
ncbi:Protein T2, partial [Tyrophagus putrescentiae]